MIIPVFGVKSIEEYLTDIFVVELPEKCFDCGRNLWRHGAYSRKALTLDGAPVAVWIPRLWCPDCRVSISCLYEFLIPFKQYVLTVFWTYVNHVIEKSYSLREAAWSEEDGDREDAGASVSRAFRAMDEAGKWADQALRRMQEKLVEEGIKWDEMELHVKSPVARSADKQRRLDLLAYANALYKRFWGDASAGLLLFWSRTSSRYASSNLGYWLSAPQSLKHPPF